MKGPSRFRALPPRFKTINARLAFMYSMLIVIVIGCIITAIAGLFSLLTRQNNRIVYHSLEVIGESVENRINIVRRLIPVIQSDYNVRRALAEGKYNDAALSRMSSLYAYGLQDAILITTRGKALNSPYYQNDAGRLLLEITGYDEFIASGKEELFSSPHGFPFLLPPDQTRFNNRISYFYTLRDRQNFEVYGYVMFVITIDSLLADRFDLSNSPFDNLFLCDNTGNNLYSLSGGSEGEEISSHARAAYTRSRDTEFENHGGNTYFYSRLRSYPKWYLVGVVSNQTLNNSIRLVLLTTAFFGFVGILFIILFSKAFSRSITQPIKMLSDSMKAFEFGRTPSKIEIAASGEMKTLVSGFNIMLDDINMHLETIVREQEEKKNAEVSALRYQLESLQNQINPHFLYNTLNIISFLALDGKNEEIRDFNQSLIALLRSTLSNTQDYVTISREINFLESYVRLMEYRYPKMFVFETSVDPSILDCLIPKLILQPLVENSLLHGIFPMSREGRLSAVITDTGKTLHVCVKDNGVGMDKEALNGLFLERKGFTGIGVNNVNDRLKLCYGTEAALKISSQRGAGTTVEFVIPKQREEDRASWNA